MTELGIAVGNDGFDCRSSLAEQPKRSRAEEALAVLGNLVEKNEARENAPLGRIREAGVSGDHGARRGNREYGNAFQRSATPE
jgi:hypothetical protein